MLDIPDGLTQAPADVVSYGVAFVTFNYYGEFAGSLNENKFYYAVLVGDDRVRLVNYVDTRTGSLRNDVVVPMQELVDIVTSWHRCGWPLVEYD